MAADLELQLDAALIRAAHAESRLYSFRQHHAARTRLLQDFIKSRAPALWDEYAALSVNGSLYSEKEHIEPIYERELNLAVYRAQSAEDEATRLRAELATLRNT